MTLKKIIANMFRENFGAFTRFNAHKFAKQHNMVIDSIPLSDGTTAKILCDSSQFNVFVMKNGKILTARGKASSPNETYNQLQSIYSHIKIKGRADKEFKIDEAWDNMIDRFEAKTKVSPDDSNMYLYEW